MLGAAFKIRYGFKDFQNHMGISSNITLKGMIKRSMRKYPRIAQAVKSISLGGSIYFILMSFIPGSSLPLQRPIKVSILSFSQFFSKSWYYNIFNPDPQTYLIRISQILLAGIDMQIFDLQFTASTFREVREVYGVEKKQMSKSAFWDILIYSEIVLQNIIRYEKKLLLEREIYQHYQWIFSTMVVEFEGVDVMEKQNSHLNLVLSLVQYLLNFGEEKSKGETIHSFYRLIKDCDPKAQASRFDRRIVETSMQNKQFIQSLKSIHSLASSQTLKSDIMGIFDKIDKIYQQSISSPSKQVL